MEISEGTEGRAEEAMGIPVKHGGLPEETLAAGVAAGLERLIGLFRSLSPASGLSLTAAATLATLERSGPSRLTRLAGREGVTQPAMTQLIARLEDAGLVDRAADPADGRVVQVRITADGRAMLAGRRAVRAERVAGLLDRLSPDERAALAAALPAMDALANAERGEPVTADAPANAERAEPVAGDALASVQRAEPVTAGLTIGEQ
jgi:DNA-binding MarR family transcriptional regulator